jgi:hypothetical protein
LRGQFGREYKRACQRSHHTDSGCLTHGTHDNL